jgi:uncharacterized protein YjdB
VTALRPGTAAIEACRGTRVTEVVFTVTRVEVSSVRLSPPAATLAVADELRLEAVASDRLGGMLSDRVVVWLSSDDSVATIHQDGQILARAPGTAILTATVGTAAAELTLRVTPALVAGVRIDPGQISLGPGESVELTAVAVNPRGRAIPGMVPAWVCSDPGIVSITSEGIITGLRPGSARVAATLGGRRTTAVVTVTPVSRRS